MVENRGSIVDALAGKRIFLTGVTGFLGQVILERILLDFPETNVTVLVRSQQSSTAVDRVHYLTRKPSFDVLRERLGGDDALLARLDAAGRRDRRRLQPRGSPRSPPGSTS